MKVRVVGLDHVVLVVSDVEASLRWYVENLGMATERVEEWRRGEVLFPSLRVDEGTVIDLLPGEAEGRNVDHVALVVEGADLDAVAASGELDVLAGPADLWGARGVGRGVYVRDPDGHVIELRSYDS